MRGLCGRDVVVVVVVVKSERKGGGGAKETPKATAHEELARGQCVCMKGLSQTTTTTTTQDNTLATHWKVEGRG